MLRVVIFSLVASALQLQINALFTGNENCDKLGILVYQDIGCKPVVRPHQECPVSYECPDFSRKMNSCWFRKTFYPLSTFVGRVMLSGTCYVDCACERYPGEPKAEFKCAARQTCPQLRTQPEPGCYWKYDLKNCCPVELVCPHKEPFAGSRRARCDLNGVTLREGEKFYPSEKCWNCVCDGNFTGSIQPPSCRRPNCATQLQFLKELEQFCAPAYLSGSGVFCCPDTWICPSEQDYIIQLRRPQRPEYSLQCKFGSKTLQYGEGFQRQVTHNGRTHRVECECSLPPLLTCKSY